MNPRPFVLASALVALSAAGVSLAQPPAPAPTPPLSPVPTEVPPLTRVRPTLDIAGTHIVEMSLYFAQPSEAFDTGITVSGFRADGCGFVAEVAARTARAATTVFTLGVRATASCAPENKNQDTGFTVSLGALAAGHYEVTLGGLRLPFDVQPVVRISDEWAVRLAAVQQYRNIGVHACGMPPYYSGAGLFPEALEAFKRDHADVWARVIQITTVTYPPSPEEAAARLSADAQLLQVTPGPDGTWNFAFTSSSCCSTTTTRGVARVTGAKVALPADGALIHQTVARPGCNESDFPV